MLLMGVAASVIVHGLAGAAFIEWQGARPENQSPQVISVGMVTTQALVELSADTLRSSVESSFQPIERTRNEDTLIEVDSTSLSEPTEGPALEIPAPPAAMEAIAPPDRNMLEIAALPRVEPVPIEAPPPLPPSPAEVESQAPSPPVFYEEGTQEVLRSVEEPPGLPDRRPPVPAEFASAEPPARAVPSEQPAAPTSSPSSDMAPSELTATAAPSVASTMTIQPASYTGPGLANPGPAYPRSARRRGEEGTVVLRVIVSAGGEPQTVQLVSSSGYSSLDEAAIDAVEDWRFIPARRGDLAVPATIDVPIAFRLSD
ncbi:MAG: energy transducer TonB [Pseudomonadota bacterium]